MKEKSVDISLVIQKNKKGMFYYPTHSTRIVETRKARFIENGETSESEALQNVEIKEVRVQVLVASISSLRVIVLYVVETHINKEEQQINDHEANNEPIVEQPQEVVLRRSHRDRKFAISNDYVVYL